MSVCNANVIFDGVEQHWAGAIIAGEERGGAKSKSSLV